MPHGNKRGVQGHILGQIQHVDGHRTLVAQPCFPSLKVQLRAHLFFLIAHLVEKLAVPGHTKYHYLPDFKARFELSFYLYTLYISRVDGPVPDRPSCLTSSVPSVPLPAAAPKPAGSGSSSPSVRRKAAGEDAGSAKDYVESWLAGVADVDLSATGALIDEA